MNLKSRFFLKVSPLLLSSIDALSLTNSLEQETSHVCGIEKCTPTNNRKAFLEDKGLIGFEYFSSKEETPDYQVCLYEDLDQIFYEPFEDECIFFNDPGLSGTHQSSFQLSKDASSAIFFFS